MELNQFVKLFAAQFEETPIESFTPDTKFKEIEEWDSLTALSIIAMVDEELGKRITGNDIRNSNTISELFDRVLSK